MIRKLISGELEYSMRRAFTSDSSSLSLQPATRLAVALLLVVGGGCGGRASTDPLASIAEQVDEDERTPAPLVEVWSGTPEATPILRPAVGDAAVYLAIGNKLLAWRAADGAEAWDLELNSQIGTAPVAHAGQVVVGTIGDEQFPPRIWWISSQGDVSDSRIVERPPRELRGTGASVVFLDDAGVNRIEGDDSWSVPLEGTEAVELSARGDVAYVTLAAGNLVALETAQGGRRWQFSAAGDALTRPAVAPETVYVAGSGGRVIALDARNGSRRWERRLGVAVVGAPAVVGNLLWVAALDAQLHAINAGNGTAIHALPLSSRNYLDVGAFGDWAIVGPRYGPWVTLRAPTRAERSTVPIQVRVSTAAPTDPDLTLPPAAGPAGVALVKGDGTVLFLQPQRAR